jgi:hypothetical protein
MGVVTKLEMSKNWTLFGLAWGYEMAYTKYSRPEKFLPDL